MKPTLVYHLDDILHNAQTLRQLANEHQLNHLAFVTKSFCADLKVVEVLAKAKPDYLADSRILNLEKMQHIDIPKLLLRIPMLSEIENVIKYADISFNSEMATMSALNEEAKKQNKIHRVCLMIDMGDLREGIMFNDCDAIYDTCDHLLRLRHLELYGIAVNMTCYGGVLPTSDNLNQFVKIAKEIEAKYSIKLNILSGGNSSAYNILVAHQMPCEINQLRFGELLLLGTETADSQAVLDLSQDTVTLQAQIIELKIKPSVPIGKIGLNAFGQKIVFEDKGNMKRAIIGIGKQDVDADALFCKDDRVSIIGQSSDHTILELSDTCEYQVGDIIEFKTNYLGLMRLATSAYVSKEYK